MLKGIERLLRAHGFDAELFYSVEDFQERANLREAICLVLDINLNGRSGIELRREIAIAGVSIPVIFITANDSDTTRKAAIEAGCVAYLAKPFPAKSLVEAIVAASAEASRTE
jgi:FixJ family two-component response regulator